MRSLITGMVICTLLLGNFMAIAVAQPSEDSAKEKSSKDQIKPIKSEKINSDDVAKEFATKRDKDQKIKAADEFLKQKGFSAKTKAKDAFGWKETYKGKDEKGTDREDVFTLKVNDYEKKGSKDGAAIAEVEVVSGEERQVYSFVLLTPEGDINQTEEYAVVESEGKARVEKAHSWWSCTKSKIGSCGPVCVGSLLSCTVAAIAGGPFSWATYLACVAAGCGGCYLYYSSCCSCDCAWWCKWACGCCDR